MLVEEGRGMVMDTAERPEVVAWLLNWRVILARVDGARCIFGEMVRGRMCMELNC